MPERGGWSRSGTGDGDAAPGAVVGATGKTGRAVAAALLGAGGPGPGRGAPGPRGRRPRRERHPSPSTSVTGQGLAAALDGARAAYHLAPNVHPDEVGIAARVARCRGSRRPAAARLPLGAPPRRRPDAAPPAQGRGGGAAARGPRRAAHRAAPGGLPPEPPRAGARRDASPVPYSLDAPFTNVDLEDVGEVAADALLGAHAGATLDLAGPGGADHAADGRAGGGGAGAAGRRAILATVAGPGAALADLPGDLVAMFRRTTRWPGRRPTHSAALAADHGQRARRRPGRPAAGCGGGDAPLSAMDSRRRRRARGVAVAATAGGNASPPTSTHRHAESCSALRRRRLRPRATSPRASRVPCLAAWGHAVRATATALAASTTPPAGPARGPAPSTTRRGRGAFDRAADRTAY